MTKTLKEYKDDIWYACTLGKDLKKAERILNEAIKVYPDKEEELKKHYEMQKGFSIMF